MIRIKLFLLLSLSPLCVIHSGEATAQTPAERLDEYLSSGRIDAGTAELSAALEDDENPELRYALGVLEFVDAVENLGRAWYRHGLRSDRRFAGMLPFLRLPVPINDDPEPIDYARGRAILDAFRADLMEAEAILADFEPGDVTLPLHLGRARLDFNADGEPDENEALWRIYASLSRGTQITPEQAEQFVINLDAGDVYWLRGYCHLLSGLLEFHLSHDSSRLFEHTAHLYFADPVQPYPFLDLQAESGRDFGHWMDVIALIHLIDLPVVEPDRNERALAHFREVIDLSRHSWDAWTAETDDDREWIPNPSQTGVVPDTSITPEMVDSWQAFLDEAEKILAGKLLIPFWRSGEDRGVNLERFLLERERFDLVLWIQGTAAAPFLEDGEKTQPEFWRRLNRNFGGRFMGFALWFN